MLHNIYITKKAVYNFIIPKINWENENCGKFSFELKWLIDKENNRILKSIETVSMSILKMFSVQIEINLKKKLYEISTLQNINFHFYHYDYVDLLEHILTNCRICFGRPNTLIIIRKLWEMIPVDSHYAERYQNIMVKAVGSEPLLC